MPGPNSSANILSSEKVKQSRDGVGAMPMCKGMLAWQNEGVSLLMHDTATAGDLKR